MHKKGHLDWLEINYFSSMLIDKNIEPFFNISNGLGYYAYLLKIVRFCTVNIKQFKINK